MTKEEFLKECELAFSEVPENATAKGFAIHIKLVDKNLGDNNVGVLTRYHEINNFEVVGMMAIQNKKISDDILAPQKNFEIKKMMHELSLSVREEVKKANEAFKDGLH